ncbi:MAG: hypothetical protein JXA87_05210 [Thermoleophilia bacterium]|nr:hypothetical protein [Thermoleophilia bacterium]
MVGSNDHVQGLRDDQVRMRQLETHVRLSYVKDGVYAAELLRQFGEHLPDEERTLEFVMRCNCAFGFSPIAEPVAGSDLETTFAALAPPPRRRRGGVLEG